MLMQGGGFFVRNGRHINLGGLFILAGIVIILSLVLPSQFWWFLLAGLLIYFGIWLNRCR